MAATTSVSAKAERWGALWGARADDWAVSEEQQLPTYVEAIRRTGIGAGQRVLELGCGSGVFLRAASDRGAEVFGLDASEALLALARKRVPEADLRRGDMQFLPYEDDFFDVVAGFNSFFFAADMVAALHEAGRVAKPGAPVLIQVWGRPEHCDLEAMKHAVEPFLPPPDPNVPRGSALWEPGVLEGTGLTPESTFDISWAYEYADEDALARALLAAGGIVEVVGPSREEVRDAIVEAMAPYRAADGGYRLDNEWHYLLTSS
jgi:SAM-dependent methyltransferase